jgi:hypothetical protein
MIKDDFVDVWRATLAGSEQWSRSVRLLLVAFVMAWCVASRASAADPIMDTLVAAYPDHLKGYSETELIWTDGTHMPIRDGREGKSFQELIDSPNIIDQFAIPYPLGHQTRPPVRNEDPGRIRNQAFFTKIYGDCRKGEVAQRLVPVQWLPRFGGPTIMATSVNGVAAELAAVSDELEKLPARMKPFLLPIAGIYDCRSIAGTSRSSFHAYGAAIDLNAKLGDYWRWVSTRDGAFSWRNRIPLEIVDIFERHGFIWGGKWFHFDTLHFEYRPEIIALARRGWPAP